jgi:hypothetical protein
VPFQRRSYWLAASVIAYVCLGALPGATRPLVPLLGLLLLPIWLAEVWRRTHAASEGERQVEAGALSALRLCHFGAALWVAARLGADGRASRDAMANLGTGMTAVFALVALARIPSGGGLLTPAPSTRSLDAAGFVGLLWGIAVALPGVRALFGSNAGLLDPLAIDYATTTAGVGTLLVFVAAAVRFRVQRRLEIGVVDRIAGALALSLTALFVSVPAAAADIAPPDRVLPVGVLAASLACAWTATTREPTSVSIALRGVLAVMILGVPTTLFAGIAARAYPMHAGPIVLSACVIAIAVGTIARDAARPFGPEQSRWLDAIEKASRGALQPDPDAAIRAALESLAGAYRNSRSKPELWRSDPQEVLSVDIAGYLHVTKASAPDRIYPLALEEPERTLRADVLKALEVRRPDVRPLLAWFESRGAFSATLVVDEDGTLGFLLLPHGGRKNPMTLEEARAVRILCDRISALFAVSSALARSRERELDATGRAGQLETERQRLEHIISLSSGRHHTFAELVARPVLCATYSPAARFALDHVTRLGRGGDPLVLVTPPGVNAAAWGAIAHLASPGGLGALVVIDGASGAEHDATRWDDPDRSPIALADGGTLVVLDVAALPEAIQDRLAMSIGRRGRALSTSQVPEARIVFSVREPVDAMARNGRLSRALAARLGPSVDLPPLSMRAEDLRGMVLERLAGAGMRRRGEPLGISPPALAALVEHEWPGNDSELADVLLRAAEVAAGPLVTVQDLEAIGFRRPAESAPAAPPPPPESRRRRSTRPRRTARSG